MPGSTSNSKIFINYRRSDTRGEAGRLMDTLSEYLGEGMVFRDIEGIEGGANFEEVLRESVGSASAVIVLIGPNWLNAKNTAGERRLDNPEDWVAKEIASAMEAGLPIFPVLVEDAQMPSAYDLPDLLKPLVRYNAVHLSDKRWNFDVTRLAKIIAFDLPGSLAERYLDWVRLAAVIPLFLTNLFTAGLVVFNAWGPEKPSLPPLLSHQYPHPALLELWQSGISFAVIVGVSVLLLVFAKLLDKSRRIYFYLGGLTGLAGALVFYILLIAVDLINEPTFLFFGSIATSSLVFLFMCLSGFKAR